MKVYKNGSVVFNSIDNTGSSNEASLGARYAKARLDSTDNNLTLNYYTKEQVIALIEEALNEANLLKAMVVPEVPAVESASPNIIYLVPVEGEANTYSQHKKVLTSRNPDTYSMALLGSTEIEIESIQVTELPAPTAVVGKRVFQYVGGGDVLDRGRFYWCAPKNYYAWDYVSGGGTGDEGTYYAENDPMLVGDTLYSGAWVGEEFVVTSFSKAVSISGTDMTDDKAHTYRRASTKDVATYHWVPLLTKLSQYENDGDGTSPFVTQAGLTTALDAKQNSIMGAASTIAENNLTASRVLVSNSDGKVAASSITEEKLGYLSGVKSDIQQQIDSMSSGGATCSRFTVTMNSGGSNISINDQHVFKITIGSQSFLTGYLDLNFKKYRIGSGWTTFEFTKMNFSLLGNMPVAAHLTYVNVPIVGVIQWNGIIALVTPGMIDTGDNTHLQMTFAMLPMG